MMIEWLESFNQKPMPLSVTFDFLVLGSGVWFSRCCWNYEVFFIMNFSTVTLTLPREWLDHFYM